MIIQLGMFDRGIIILQTYIFFEKTKFSYDFLQCSKSFVLRLSVSEFWGSLLF